MASGTEELRSLLKDVTLSGVVVIPKKKLLWLLGWGQDREGAWKDLMAEWKEIGEKPETLCGVEVWDKIVLTMKVPGVLTNVSEWAGS